MRRDLTMAGATVALMLAAAIPLHRVFTTTDWRPAVLATIVVATTLAATARRLRVPAPVALVVSLVALIAFAARTHALEFGPWPTPEALRELWQLGRQGFEDIQLQPAPTDPLDSIRLLLSGGVWLATHVTHEALVRLRRPGVALVSSGLLWFTPLAVPRSADLAAWPNALPFFLVGGLVLLLDPDPDSSGWAVEEDQPRLSISGVALAGVAAVLGLVAPWLLPGYGQEAWVDVTAATEPRGYQPIVDVGDRLNLPAPRDVMSVTSPRANYLRLAALETFDGRTWRLGPPDVDTFRPDPDELFRTDDPLPFEADIRAGTTVPLSVEVLDLENIYVPVPYQVQRIDGPENANLFYSRQGGFVATADIEDNELQGDTRVGVREGFTYDVESFVPAPTHADLVALGDLRVPSDDPRVALPEGYEDLGALVDEVAADAGATTTIDTVLAVQNHFIGPDSPFVYSTEVPELRGDDALRQFLFETQVGYCEYYATAMAVMLRAADIPARVAVGFLPGRVTTKAPAEGEPATFTVSTSDAHAWVEVFFDDYGWIQMDPTPRSEGLPASSEDLFPQPELIAPETQDDATTGPDGRDERVRGPDAAPTFDDQLPEGGGAFDAASGLGRGLSRSLVVLAMLLVLTAVTAVWVYGEPGLRRAWARHHDDPATDVLASMHRVLATAAHLGVGRRADQTVTEVAWSWARDGLVDTEDAVTFARLASTAAFASGGTTPAEAVDDDDAQTMRGVETRLVAGFHAAIEPRRRLTAPWRHAARRVSALGERLTSR